MSLLLNFVIIILCLKLSKGFETDSSEVNHVENGILTPLYDAIVFNDIADILNEFDNNGNWLIDTLQKSASDSDENIEDLLLEYHHYLDKAQKQRKTYIERKSKNKIPMIRHEAYVKKMPSLNPKNDNYYYYNPNADKLAQTYYNSPLEMIIPLNSKIKYYNADLGSTQPKGDMRINEEMLQNVITEQKRGDFPAMIYSPMDTAPMPYSGCRECSMKAISKNHNENYFNYNIERLPLSLSPIADQSFETFNRIPERLNENIHDINDNTLNIRVKVEIQLPKTQESHAPHRCKNHSHTRNLERHYENSKEIMPSSVTLPVSYFNFPVPLEMFGLKKYSKMDSNPSHKLVVHKKKKPRTNTNNKKHKKKVITFHNVKLESHSKPKPILEETFINSTESNINPNETGEINTKVDGKFKNLEATKNITKSDVIKPIFNDTVNVTESVNSTMQINETQAEEKNTLNVKKSHGFRDMILVISDDIRKSENSIDIENEEMKQHSNLTALKLPIPRHKRQIGEEVTKSIILIKNPTTKQTTKIEDTLVKQNDSKTSDKSLFADAELLYWPTVPKNTTFIKTNNITSIILEREDKKAKLNISHETIRQNHTKALEKAIFGDVDWDDMDTVAPVFISFAGKYIKGVLTFCSQTNCHSVKCGDKTCVHRTCAPSQRTNLIGHCARSNETDSVASMESIMDLPSNTAVEIVNILHNKLQGKLYGKCTLCISSKCISFATSKKIFLKSKCTTKDLNSLGHCPYTKSLM